MRHIYKYDRLNMVVNRLIDRITDIHSFAMESLSDIDHTEHFKIIQEMLDSIELEADDEYEYAVRHAHRPLFGKKEKVPEPSIDVSHIIEYAKSKGLECVGMFPYALSSFEVAHMYTSTYNLSFIEELYTQGGLPCMRNEFVKSFMVYDPRTESKNKSVIERHLYLLKNRFKKVINNEGVSPDSVNLTSDEQEVLDQASDFIKEYDDKMSVIQDEDTE